MTTVVLFCCALSLSLYGVFGYISMYKFRGIASDHDADIWPSRSNAYEVPLHFSDRLYRVLLIARRAVRTLAPRAAVSGRSAQVCGSEQGKVAVASQVGSNQHDQQLDRI